VSERGRPRRRWMARGQLGAAALAWMLCTAALLASVGGAVLGAVVPPADSQPISALEPLFLVVIMLPGIVYPLVGAFVVSRRRSNPVAWIFVAIGVGWGLQLLAQGANESASAAGGGETVVFAWIGSWVWMISAGLAFVFVPLLYPTGGLLSPRWRPFAVTAGAIVALQLIAAAFAPGPLGLDEQLANPVGIHGPAGELLRLVSPSLFGMLPFAAVTLGAVASLVIRFRRSRGQERQQIKWLAYAAGVTAVLFLVQVVTILGPTTSTLDIPLFVSDLSFAFVIAGFASMPAAAGIAILRYRLYDIDLLINRTLVYGALTLTLGALYAGSVILFQGLLAAFASAGGLAVAATTLGVAALFQPARRRIQRAVDRRFYRSRYDAQLTLAAFSASLRHEVDLDRLTGQLTGVVEATVQPASASVWLRPEPVTSRPAQRT